MIIEFQVTRENNEFFVIKQLSEAERKKLNTISHVWALKTRDPQKVGEIMLQFEKIVDAK